MGENLNDGRGLEIENVKQILGGELYGYSNLECGKLPRGMDIKGEKNGQTYFFAVSVLNPNNHGVYFGSTNTSEWKKVLEEKDNIRFVLCRADLDIFDKNKVIEFTPEELLQYSDSCSFKLSFHVKFDALNNLIERNNSKFTKDVIARLLNKE